MRYATFSRHISTLLADGSNETREAVRTALAAYDIAFWGGQPLDQYLQDVAAIRARLRPFLPSGGPVEVDHVAAMMATLTPALRIDIGDAVIMSAEDEPDVPTYYYTAEDAAGDDYQLAWQPAASRLSVTRAGDRVSVSHGGRLAEALAAYFR